MVNFRLREEPCDDRKFIKSESEWLQALTPEQYQVTRQHATERPFSGDYVNCKTSGVYLCVCCGEA